MVTACRSEVWIISDPLKISRCLRTCAFFVGKSTRLSHPSTSFWHVLPSQGWRHKHMLLMHVPCPSIYRDCASFIFFLTTDELLVSARSLPLPLSQRFARNMTQTSKSTNWQLDGSNSFAQEGSKQNAQTHKIARAHTYKSERRLCLFRVSRPQEIRGSVTWHAIL